MHRNLLSTTFTCLLLALMCDPFLSVAQTDAAKEVPLPAQIISAKKVFVANAGEDPLWNFKHNSAYFQLYSSLKKWGHYDLVGTPSDADLVLQVQLIGTRWQSSDTLLIPMLKLSILDPKTSTPLWVINERIELGRRLDQRFDDAMDRVVNDFKAISTAQNATPASTQ